MDVLRETALRLSHHALEVGNCGIREVDIRALFYDIFRRQIVLHHEDRQVTDHLGGRCDLDDIAEHLIDRLVHILDFLELVTQTEGFHLCLQIGVLASRNLVFINFRGCGLQFGFKVLVNRTYISPVFTDLLQTVGIQSGIAVGMLQRSHDGVQRRLRGQTGHRVERRIDDVNTRLRCHEYGGYAVAGRIMRVQMNRNADFLFECTDQLGSCRWLEQTGHILDAENVRAALFQLFRHSHIVAQRIFGLGRVQNIPGIAQARLCDHALVERLVERYLHALDPVQRVKDTEYIDAGFRGLLDELTDHVVRIILISDCVRAAQQHLQQNVRALLAQNLQSLPWVLLEETICGVEGCAAPHLKGEKVAAVNGDRRCDLFHVDGSHACRHQGLLCVTHRSIGHEQSLLLAYPLGKILGAHFVEELLGASAL